MELSNVGLLLYPSLDCILPKKVQDDLGLTYRFSCDPTHQFVLMLYIIINSNMVFKHIINLLTLFYSWIVTQV